MTERSDPPVPQTKRRRKATPSGHIEVAPASVGQGAQVEAATNATGPAQRRAPRKRTAKRTADASTAIPPSPADEAAAAVVDIAAAAASDVERPGQAATPTPAAKPNARAAARRGKSSAPMPETSRAEAPSPDIVPKNGVSTDIASKNAVATEVVAANIVVAAGAADTAPAPFDTRASESPDIDNAHIAAASPAMNDDTMQDAAALDDVAAAESAAESATGDPSEPPSTDAAGHASEEHAFEEHAPDEPPPPEPPHHHGWVYLALGVFALALLFGAWGVWTVWFSGGEDDARDAASLIKRNDGLRQEIATLRRSDQISREANRDLQRTLAERDEEISGLRADVAFYERFVGATGQRRGLSVHDLEMQSQSDGAWHFVATLTQNLNRGAVNTGRLTVSVEGTRKDRLERLSWTRLRQQNNAPGVAYSFKYFQQVEGDLLLPKDFKPMRVTVRLVPSGGSAVDQSFAWAEILDRNPNPVP